MPVPVGQGERDGCQFPVLREVGMRRRPCMIVFLAKAHGPPTRNLFDLGEDGSQEGELEVVDAAELRVGDDVAGDAHLSVGEA